jgi:hypothetical protein
MTKRIPLDRLREISRQRSIRGEHVPPVRSDEPDPPDGVEPDRIEWPIRTSLWLQR